MSVGPKSVQNNRYELKYLISDRTALSVRDFIADRLNLDEHMDPAVRDGYWVHSLYLDNSNYALCKATMDGEKNRFKLRARFYSDEADAPVFLEVKRRVSDCILKSRAAIHRDAAAELMEGRHPKHTDLQGSKTRQAFDALGRFCQLRDQIDARPAAYTSYQREAYVSIQDESCRVTFDRLIKGGPWRREIKADRDGWLATDINHVVLELKFTHRFPMWMRELSHHFQLQRTSVPKYVECVRAMRKSPLRLIAGVGAMR